MFFLLFTDGGLGTGTTITSRWPPVGGPTLGPADTNGAGVDAKHLDVGDMSDVSDVSRLNLKELKSDFKNNAFLDSIIGWERSFIRWCRRSLESRHWTELSRSSRHLSTMRSTKNYSLRRGKDVWWVIVFYCFHLIWFTTWIKCEVRSLVFTNNGFVWGLRFKNLD